MILDIVKVFLPATIAFTIGILITPIVANFLYKHRFWKKKSVALAIDGSAATISQSLHKDEVRQTPRMGGVIIWLAVLATAGGIWLIDQIFPTELGGKLDFVSRSQTWIPLFALLIGSLVGLIDDYLGVSGMGGYVGGGLSLWKRLCVVALLGLAAALWFYFKLDVTTISAPIIGEVYLGFFFVPFFILVMLAIYSGGVIDGIDGLAGGVFASMFGAYAFIAFFQQQIDLAAFCAVVVGGLLAFLWFNIPPARFFMSETGTMGLTVALSIVAFMSDRLGGGNGLIALPFIALPLIITTSSVIIQLLSKKFVGRKVFLVAPIHHHFQALGWPPYKVAMRFWVASVIFSIFGMIFALVG